MNAMMLVVVLVVACGSTRAQGDPITVCVEGGIDLPVVSLAEGVTSRMFAAIGVEIRWKLLSPSCPKDAIVVSHSYRTPAKLLPGALAYTLPNEGTTIRIFMDRIQKGRGCRDDAYVLAHVMVHEITHILQGLPRHSPAGVMKSRWGFADYSEMLFKTLAFTPLDVDLIHDGMKQRAARLSAKN
jgi:hypothetical protein